MMDWSLTGRRRPSPMNYTPVLFSYERKETAGWPIPAVSGRGERI